MRTNLSAKPSGAPGEPPRTPGNAKVMGAPEVLGEQVSTPFAGHDLPGVLREQLHGLSDPSDAPQRAGDALSKRNGMDSDAFATALGPKRGKNSMRARVTHRHSPAIRAA